MSQPLNDKKQEAIKELEADINRIFNLQSKATNLVKVDKFLEAELRLDQYIKNIKK